MTELNNLGLHHLCLLFGKMATIVHGHTSQNESTTIVRAEKCEKYLVIRKGTPRINKSSSLLEDVSELMTESGQYH